MEWVLSAVCVYIMIGGSMIATFYLELSKIQDSNKKLARAILLIPFWGPVAIYYAIKLPLVGLWWVCQNAFKED